MCIYCDELVLSVDQLEHLCFLSKLPQETLLLVSSGYGQNVLIYRTCLGDKVIIVYVRFVIHIDYCQVHLLSKKNDKLFIQMVLSKTQSACSHKQTLFPLLAKMRFVSVFGYMLNSALYKLEILCLKRCVWVKTFYFKALYFN